MARRQMDSVAKFFAAIGLACWAVSVGLTIYSFWNGWEFGATAFVAFLVGSFFIRVSKQNDDDDIREASNAD